MTSVVTVELTQQDFINISKWLHAAGTSIEAKLRIMFTNSECDTFSKLNQARAKLRRH